MTELYANIESNINRVALMMCINEKKPDDLRIHFLLNHVSAEFDHIRGSQQTLERKELKQLYNDNMYKVQKCNKIISKRKQCKFKRQSCKRAGSIYIHDQVIHDIINECFPNDVKFSFPRMMKGSILIDIHFENRYMQVALNLRVPDVFAKFRPFSEIFTLNPSPSVSIQCPNLGFFKLDYLVSPREYKAYKSICKRISSKP